MARITASRYVTDLVASGRYTFTTAQAQAALGVSQAAVQAALRRLRSKRVIAVPARGFHVIVPPEYRHLGCLPASEFVPELMEQHFQAPYYAGLLTAAELHGAAHHKPQVFQVVTDRNRRPAGAGRIRIVFFAKADIESTPTAQKATRLGFLRVSTPEATAFDLVSYLQAAGGLDHVATVLAELAESLDPIQLGRLAHSVPMVVAQRLGFLLDLVGQSAVAEPLAAIVTQASPPMTPLRTGRSLRGAERDRKWRLGVNTVVEPDV